MRALFRNMPWSLSWFVLTGAIFLLQLFPYTGIFLMMVAAPLWSIATINLGFLSLAVEALLGRISMIWLAVPLAWFAGYAGAAHISQQRATELDAKLRAANAGERLKFEAAKQALVFDGRSDDLSGAPSSIVQNYRIPVAYQVRTEKKQRIHHASRWLPIRSATPLRRTGATARRVSTSPGSTRARRCAVGASSRACA